MRPIWLVLVSAKPQYNPMVSLTIVLDSSILSFIEFCSILFNFVQFYSILYGLSKQRPLVKASKPRKLSQSLPFLF